ncbi:hypothetical protein [Sphingomonas panacisoli]|uniref:hypothetical protein n=1 Tax=Sphingomonas panacisoli TaxID=1813879 RepID=UPI001F023D43|nr:hypothetical protein [Sphingomonas panacisoli]
MAPPLTPSSAPTPPAPMAGMDMAGGKSMAGMPGMRAWPPRRFAGCQDFPDAGPDGIVAGGTRCQPGSGSGTSRLPAIGGAMTGVHVMSGGWMLMLHGYAWGAYTDQSGPRGDRSGFVSSMAMAEAQRDLGNSGATLKLMTMLSLDPLMGKRGYPSLLATGETANGVTALIDRQHPHDLFMELSARIDVPIGPSVDAFVYGGPVAEPALGPSAFMHRASAKYLPLAPITHHWFDSTHITFGVVTVGLNTTRWQIEGSAFRGREPDQYRWDIETPALDSWSVRATWNPSANWSAQVSYGRLKSPEALEPGIDEARTTASVQYASGGFSALAGFSSKDRLPGRTLTAWIGEANWDLGDHHSLFGRIENVANDELFPDHADPLHDRPFRVTRGELGYAYRLKLFGPVEAAVGGSGLVIGKPRALDGAYGRSPAGWTGFVKLSLGG